MSNFFRKRAEYAPSCFHLKPFRTSAPTGRKHVTIIMRQLPRGRPLPPAHAALSASPVLSRWPFGRLAEHVFWTPPVSRWKNWGQRGETVRPRPVLWPGSTSGLPAQQAAHAGPAAWVIEILNTFVLAGEQPLPHALPPMLCPHSPRPSPPAHPWDPPTCSQPKLLARAQYGPSDRQCPHPCLAGCSLFNPAPACQPPESLG